MKNKPGRGEVWWISFDPAIGGEIQKTRPAIIISNDSANANLNRVQVVPVSSNTGKLYPAEAIISVGNKKGKAMADQLTTASILRLKSKITVLSKMDIRAVEDAIKVQLALR